MTAPNLNSPGAQLVEAECKAALAAMPTLKPCPFCGGRALAVEDDTVTCFTRHCALWCVRVPRKAWNRRAQ